MWLREDGTPYYIGKGSTNRAFKSHGHIGFGGVPPKERILIQEFPSAEDALFAEMLLIALYGRIDLGTGILYNRTDGGTEPPSPKGRRLSDETKRKLSARKMGNKHTLGKKLSQERRDALRAFLTGRPKSEAHKAKMRLRVISDETRRKIGLRSIGNTYREGHARDSRGRWLPCGK